MYELVKEGKPELTAAQQVHREMKLDGNDPVERLRAKFRRRRVDLAAKAAARNSAQVSQPQQPVGLLRPAELARMLEDAKAAREHAQLLEQMGINKDTVRRNIEEAKRTRSFLKWAGFKIPGSDEGEAS